MSYRIINRINKKIAIILALALIVGMLMPEINSYAWSPSTYAILNATQTGSAWVSMGNGWYALADTEIKVEITDKEIHVMGTGAIPDYDVRALSSRPWHRWTGSSLVIDAGITSIGAYAFSSLTGLKKKTMNSTTFIEDRTAFAGLAYEPVFYIHGYSELPRLYGTIIYTSLDSIKAYAQKNNVNASFLFDQPYMATAFQNSTNPTIRNVFCAYDETKPWEMLKEVYSGNKYTENCKIISNTSDGDYKVECYQKVMTTQCYEAFAALIGNYTYGAGFEMNTTRLDIQVKKTLTPLFYQLNIPDTLKAPGRQFKLISIVNGVSKILDDYDVSDDTITFLTDSPSGVFGLIYM